MKAILHDLPIDRLATTDERGRRVYLYPSDVKGKYRLRRSVLSALLMAIFLILPWVRIHGHPAVLLDVPNRRFALFGLTFWAHEAPMLIFIAAGLLLTLAFVTAVWGRVWCGWACPQTVFVDTVFRRIERWIEGDALARRTLDQEPLSAEKLAKKTAKWVLFVGASLGISHSFLAYFVGPEALGVMITQSPAQNPGAFLVMLGVFSGVLFDFGWFREQFCTVVCPYGRFQSVLMDEGSQLVAYDARRGEPRRGGTPASLPVGDCVNCYRCVQVCPTGIDIRRGAQLECIGCTACIDACDEVMKRLKKPLGLIRYSRAARVSARAWTYVTLLLFVAAGFAISLSSRRIVELTVVRAPEAPYQEVEGGKVINHFKLDLANQGFDDLAVDFSLEGESAGVAKFVVSNHAPVLKAGKAERADFFVEVPRTVFRDGHLEVSLVLSARSIGESVLMQQDREGVRLVGPYR